VGRRVYPRTVVSVNYKLEGEPVSLTFHSVLNKLYTEPSIGASYQISIHLAIRFQRRRFFLEINQSETIIACGGHVCYRIWTK
jgi:hypothetical protein